MTQVPLPRVAKFVRQLSHDVRNNLGAMDLQAALAVELVGDPEVAGELRKLRGMIANAAKLLQHVSSQFYVPQLNQIELGSMMFVEELRERIGRALPEQANRIQWQMEVGDHPMVVDIEQVFGAIVEVFRNALFFHEGKDEPLSCVALLRGGDLWIEVRQRATALSSPVETWGVDPFLTTRRNGYGLGLFHAMNVLQANRGAIQFEYNPGESALISRVRLPTRDRTDDV